MNKKLIISLFIIILQCPAIATNYSNKAIETFNAAVMLQKHGKFEQAEAKYIQAIQLQPDFKEAKKYLADDYGEMEERCFNSNNFEKALFYAKKALIYKPNDAYSIQTMAQCYTAMNDFRNAIFYYNKALTFKPTDENLMHELAQVYVKTNQLDKAEALYKKLLAQNPNDVYAKQNLKYCSTNITENTMKNSLNKISKKRTAPNTLYSLIKPSYGINQTDIEQMRTFLDLIWSDSTGKLLLSAMIENNIPINLTTNPLNGDMTRTNKCFTYGDFEGNNFQNCSSLEVNIPTHYLTDFNNQKLPSYKRIYDLQAAIHEFGHAFINIKKPSDMNSLEEELGVSMIGYNIANKVITGRYLDRKQTEMYSMRCLKDLMNDDHRDLPLYGGFNRSMQNLGVFMPYPEIYSDIPSMQKKLYGGYNQF